MIKAHYLGIQFLNQFFGFIVKSADPVLSQPLQRRPPASAAVAGAGHVVGGPDRVCSMEPQKPKSRSRGSCWWILGSPLLGFQAAAWALTSVWLGGAKAVGFIGPNKKRVPGSQDIHWSIFCRTPSDG